MPRLVSGTAKRVCMWITILFISAFDIVATGCQGWGSSQGVQAFSGGASATVRGEHQGEQMLRRNLSAGGADAADEQDISTVAHDHMSAALGRSWKTIDPIVQDYICNVIADAQPGLSPPAQSHTLLCLYPHLQRGP